MNAILARVLIMNCTDDDIHDHFNHAVNMGNGIYIYPNSLKSAKEMILDFELKSKSRSKRRRRDLKRRKRILIPTVVLITITTRQTIII